MKIGDLTTLADVRAWLGTTNYLQSNANPDVNTMIQRLISSVSAAMCAEMERPWLLPKLYNDTFDGENNVIQFLRNWPVLSVAQVAIGSQVVTQATASGSQSPVPTGFGWSIEAWDGIPPGGPSSVELNGQRFWRGKQNVAVQYTAGYQVTDEPQTIPATVPSGGNNPVLIVSEPYGMWAQDGGVKYASSGTSLVYVPTPPVVAGTYTVLPPDVGAAAPFTPTGQYQFYKDDIGEAVLITYGFIPFALQHLCSELVAERMAYRQHIGEETRSINQQISVRYMKGEWPQYAKPVFQRYRSILPI